MRRLLPILLFSIMANAQNNADFLTIYEKVNGNHEEVVYRRILDF